MAPKKKTAKKTKLLPKKRKTGYIGNTNRRKTTTLRRTLEQEYPDSTKAFMVTMEKSQAINLLLAGNSKSEVAAQLGVTPRTISEWSKEFWDLMLRSNPSIYRIWGRIIGKCLAVVERTLDGKNKEEGADIRTALTLLRTSPLLGNQAPAVSIDASKHLTVNDNSQKTDIVVNPKEDNDFTDGAIAEFERMAGFLEVPQVPERSS